jgi:hypothetical protein
MIASKNQESGQEMNKDGQQSPMVDLSIIIVNWNSKEYVRKCVQSIYANTRRITFEIIVVDGASYDGCGQMLACEFPKARFIQCEKNVGFARANNLGFTQSRGNCVLFLNPDTEVIGNALERILENLNQFPDAGIAGAKLLNSDGTIQTSCIQSFPTVLNQALDAEYLRRLFPRSRLWGFTALASGSQSPSSVEVISGACIMIKRFIFQKISGFDERYFMYSEDLDLCYRVRKAGFNCLYVPEAQIVHHGGGSSALARSMFSTVMTRESVYRCLRFHRGRFVSWGYRAAMGISSLIRLPLIAAVNGAAGKEIRGNASFRKWVFILRWSVGFESWAAKKSGDDKSVESPGEKIQDGGGVSNESEAKQCAA